MTLAATEETFGCEDASFFGRWHLSSCVALTCTVRYSIAGCSSRGTLFH